MRRKHDAVTRAWLARSDRVLLTTEAVLAEMREYYPAWVGKTAVVRLGVDVAQAPPTAQDLARFQQERGLPVAFALMAGWVLEHKNQVAVVDAMVQLRERGSPIAVVFVGPNANHLVESRELGFPGGYAARVRRALKEAGFVHGRDFFALGYVSDQDVQKLYRLATVFVLPSLYEGFGLPSLEALRAGCSSRNGFSAAGCSPSIQRIRRRSPIGSPGCSTTRTRRAQAHVPPGSACRPSTTGERPRGRTSPTSRTSSSAAPGSLPTGRFRRHLGLRVTPVQPSRLPGFRAAHLARPEELVGTQPGWRPRE
jgi:hypothetical protein